MTDTPLYLIAHKVRGQPAFDIAIQMVVRDEDDPWWILPSTGHRAHPYWQLPINRILVEDDGCGGLFADLDVLVPELPDDLPDFYRQPDTKISTPADLAQGRSLLEALGLSQPLVRRV